MPTTLSPSPQVTAGPGSYKFRDPQLAKEAAYARQRCLDADRKGRRLVKLATLGGDPEEAFEEAFASLAFSYIKDKAPRLLEHIAGFQLVDRNEDNTKAIGIFGFRLGKQWVYAPVFFLNGDLKGHELLYLKGQDLFIPLKENWVNYLLAKRPHVIGEQTSESIRSLGVLQPDIRNLSVPPYYSKYSSANDWSDWAKSFLPDLGKLVTTNPKKMEKYASLDKFTIPNLCGESLCFARMMKQACDLYPEIGRLCGEYYGRDWLKTALETLKDKATKEVEEVSSDTSILADTLDHQDRKERVEASEEVINKSGSVMLGGHQPKKASAPISSKVKVLDDVTLTRNDSELSESEREKFYQHGYLVRDEREGDEVSKAYNVQGRAELSNPSSSGLYDILVKPGQFEELLVINEPNTSKGKGDFATLLRITGKKNWVNTHRTTIWARPCKHNDSEQREAFDKLESVSNENLAVDSTYIVLCVSKAGTIEGSAPFCVDENLSDGRYKVTWHDDPQRGRPTVLRGPNQHHSDLMMGRDHHYSTAGNFGMDDKLYGCGNLLHLNDREGVRFKSMQGTLMAPSRLCKVIKVSNPHHDWDHDQSEDPAIEPGDWGDLQMQISQKTASLKVFCDGNGASLNAGPLVSKKAAFFELIMSYGFPENEASIMIKEAEAAHRRGKPTHYRVKYAAGYPMLGPGPTAPAIPEPQYGYDATYGGYPTQYQQIDHQGVPELDSSLTDQSVYDPRPEAMPDPMSMQAAQQAGQTGQKEVFDTAVISSLLKAVRQDSLVDRYTGDLMKAVDRLGRLLFLFYWHNDNFMERYGKGDLPELEDTLRNAFEIVGDLLLFLKEKDVDSLVGGVVSEPDIQESAQ